MPNPRTPTYDDLSALCAQLAAALEGVLAITHDSTGVAGYHLNGNVAEWHEFEEISDASAALTAWKTRTPDPVYAEAKNMLALLDGHNTCPECERMTGPAWEYLREKHMGDCDIGNTINRARGEG